MKDISYGNKQLNGIAAWDIMCLKETKLDRLALLMGKIDAQIYIKRDGMAEKSGNRKGNIIRMKE